MGGFLKVTLVNPNFTGSVVTQSLGLGFLATSLRESIDCQVQVVEPVLQHLNRSQVLAMAGDSEVVGITSYTESRFELIDLAAELKARNPGCLIVVGGPHATALSEIMLERCSDLDVVVRSEGEESLKEIVGGKPLEMIPGINFRQNGRVVVNPDRPLIGDIDRVNFDYRFQYFPEWKDTEVPIHLRDKKHLPIIGSRGCPFRCTFCGAHNHWCGHWRGMNPERLVDWMRFLVKEFGVGYFRFYDALFIGNDTRIARFCDALEKSGLQTSFRIDIRVGTRPDILKRLREVGCEVVGFGVESGSDRVLDRVHKGINRKQVEETIETCTRLGFWKIGFFMVSLPDETLADFNQTFSLLKYFDFYNLQFFKNHPGTPFYEELKSRGEITDSVWFDRKHGFTSADGNEFYYCRELFPSAGFSYGQVQELLEKVGSYTTWRFYRKPTAWELLKSGGRNLRHPVRLIRKAPLVWKRLRFILGREVRLETGEKNNGNDVSQKPGA